MLKKALIATITSILIFLPIQVFANDISLNIDDKDVPFTQSSGNPFIDNANRTQVPLRAALEAFGCMVEWDNINKIATVTKNEITVIVPIGAQYILVNGDAVTNDTVAQIINGRTYLPIRAVLEAFGADVTWDNNTKTVRVKSNTVLITPAITPSSGIIALHLGESQKIMLDSVTPHPWYGWFIDKYSDSIAHASFDGLHNETQNDFGVIFTGVSLGSTTFKVCIHDNTLPAGNTDISAFATFEVIVSRSPVVVNSPTTDTPDISNSAYVQERISQYKRDLAEILNDIEAAKNEKNVRVYDPIAGFIWTYDQSAVSRLEDEYQSMLDSYELFKAIYNIVLVK